jgi:hypothetical protein
VLILTVVQVLTNAVTEVAVETVAIREGIFTLTDVTALVSAQAKGRFVGALELAERPVTRHAVPRVAALDTLFGRMTTARPALCVSLGSARLLAIRLTMGGAQCILSAATSAGGMAQRMAATVIRFMRVGAASVYAITRENNRGVEWATESGNF